jgi:cytochrome c6
MRLVLTPLFMAVCLFATDGSTQASENEDPGPTLYRQNCARCHGFHMVNPAPGVFDLRTFPREDKSRFMAAVSNGKGAMPAWQATLSPQQIESLWRYVSGAGR